MSITPSIPLVQGRGKTFLRYAHEDEALLLSRRHDEIRIPLAAIARVRAEGRALAVELTAPAGAVPAVHRIDGVSEAACAMFASAVNAALPEAAGRDTTADGSALVEAHTRPVSRRERKTRLIMWWSIATVSLVVVLCVLVALAGEAIGIAVFIPVGFVGAASSVTSVVALTSWYREFRLTRHGITTLAVELTREPGTYVYTDPAGLIREVFGRPGGTFAKISYDPQDPGNVIRPRVALLRRGELCLGLFLAFCGLLMYAGLVVMTVQAFLGTLNLTEPA